MEVIKIAIVGCGDIASKAYFSNISKRYKNLEIHAVCDLVKERAELAAQTYHVPHIYTMEQICADPEIQIVLNLTNPEVHYRINKQALEAGKHVYTEKPLATTVADAKATVQLAREKGLILACAPDTVLGTGVQTCRKIIDEGRIGDILGAQCTCMYHGPESGHPRPDFLFQKGAGPMLDVGPYAIAALLYLMGSSVTELTCYGGTFNKVRHAKDHDFDAQVYTHYNSIMKMRSGATLSLDVSWDVWLPATGSITKIFGTKGTLFVPSVNDYTGDAYIIESGDLENANGWISFDKMMDMRRYQKALPIAYEGPEENRGLGLSEMAEAIARGRRDALVSGEMACHAVDIMLGCNQSISSGQPVSLTTNFTQPERLDESFYKTHIK